MSALGMKVFYLVFDAAAIGFREIISFTYLAFDASAIAIGSLGENFST